MSSNNEVYKEDDLIAGTKWSLYYDDINKLFLVYNYLVNVGASTKYIPLVQIHDNFKSFFSKEEIDRLLKEMLSRLLLINWKENEGSSYFKLNQC